ncbi:unnamed protein product [Dimorphilus gyrociliatus]|uniref:Uncharacterized protein n=1 Tax=Dimorphilus gyrociliatus TaxID=2664684 RepID=A0A7I8VLT0_9ANNE|nr:unnamed protein product [Dimorphilus gyrociliatus]
MKKKKFLSEIQQELEMQRRLWSSEISRLTEGVTINNNERSSKPTLIIGKSPGEVLFKAFFDVREYEEGEVLVNIDRILNKVVVTAVKRIGDLTKTLVQKVNLPKYADPINMSKNINYNGILEVTIPILYHFPNQKWINNDTNYYMKKINKQKKKEYYALEITVNLESYWQASKVDIEIIDDKTLLITAFTENGDKVLKRRYILPKKSDMDRISAEINDECHITVYVPFIIV